MEEEAPESPPQLSPHIPQESSKVEPLSKINWKEFGIPSIANVPFHEWLRSVTDPKNGPYPNGIHVKRMREIIHDQWKNSKLGKKSSKTATGGYWRYQNEMHLLLGKLMKAGLVKRLERSIYIGLDNGEASNQQMETENADDRVKSICTLCNKKNEAKISIQCSKCAGYWHMSCAYKRNFLPGDFMKADRDMKKLATRLKSVAPNWTCYSCKTCTICKEGEKEEKCLLICDHCDSAEHFHCQNPALESVPFSPWYCKSCSSDGHGKPVQQIKTLKMETMDIMETNSKPGPSGQQLRIGHITKHSRNSKVATDSFGLPSLRSHPLLKDIEGAEIRLWTVEKTASLFESMGHKKMAHIFRNEEIDGPAVLLMTRQDVVEHLGLKLGLALKGYRLIGHLQFLYQMAQKNGGKARMFERME